MPVMEIEKLSGDSSPQQVQAAVSACIAAEARAGREQQQAIAMCMEMARAKGATIPQPQGGGQGA